MNKIVPITISWSITILIPFIILMTVIRLLILTPVYTMIEYRMPGFPDDPYGFSVEERLQWALPTINYLVNREDVSYLENLKFEDGESVYNNREVPHLVDVKLLVKLTLKVWVGGIIYLITVSLFLFYTGNREALRKGYQTGGWFTVGLVLSILLFVVLNFDRLFTYFHYLFFEGDTWLFFASDTLIRLFPLRYFQDLFITVGLFTLLIGLLLGLSLSRVRKNECN